MSEWKKVKLKDCCLKIGSGSTPKGGSTVYVDSGTSLIRSQNVYNLLFDYNGLTHITDEAAKKLKGVTIFNEDILLNITGDSVARTCVVPNDVLPARVNQHVAIVRVDKNLMNYRFLNYYLASPKMQSHMLNLAVGKGASRNAMTKQMIENFEVPCPPLPTQHRIATILSRYDSLIENYQKQIKLLEEAAQRLYKEWFVDLRFPGYENVKVMDGVPEGWERKKLKDVFTYVRGRSYTSKELAEEGTCMVNLKNIQAFGGYNRNAEKRYIGVYKEEQSLKKGDLVMGVTDMTQERRLVGHVALIPEFNEPATFSMDLIKILPVELSNAFLYCAMRFGGLSKNISPLANGVNVLHLKPEAIMGLEMIVPSKEIVNHFDNYFNSIFNTILRYQSQIRLLTEARDRLLPKMMGGEMEV
ncbi:MAG: restriction endonuclease subunit S [Bacteroidales bacterium]|nr:restriction endonuclease subunit S [Bacteroidales bacterium]